SAAWTVEPRPTNPRHVGHDSLPPNAHLRDGGWATLRARNIRDTHGKSRSPSLRHVRTAPRRRFMFTSADEVLGYIRENDVKSVDVRFCDLPGIMQHFTVPVESFDEKIFSDGLGFDGSSIRGFQAIDESDMLLLPVPTPAVLDPFRAE